MSQTAVQVGSLSATARWLRGFWRYYRGYTQTAIHAASAAALTAFGLLIFLDPLFVILAVAAYVCPPLVLYALDADVGRPDSSEAAAGRTDSRAGSGGDSGADSDADSDSDGDDADSDSDGDDADSDSDGDDADADG